MTWEEFRSLLSGLSGDSPLGRIIQIRAETDSEIIKRFSSNQKRIRNEWINKNKRKIASPAEKEAFLRAFIAGFKTEEEV